MSAFSGLAHVANSCISPDFSSLGSAHVLVIRQTCRVNVVLHAKGSDVDLWLGGALSRRVLSIKTVKNNA